MPGATRACVPVSGLSSQPLACVLSSELHLLQVISALDIRSSLSWLWSPCCVILLGCLLLSLLLSLCVTLAVVPVSAPDWLWPLCAPVTTRGQGPAWCVVSTCPVGAVTTSGVHTATSHCHSHTGREGGQSLQTTFSYFENHNVNIWKKDKTKYAAYIQQTHSRSSSILLFCTGVHGWLAAWYDVQVYSNRYRLYSHYLSQVCDGWGPSPDIGVTHYYYGQGGWPGWGPGQATLHWLVLSWPRSALWSHTRLSAPIMGCQLLNDL